MNLDGRRIVLFAMAIATLAALVVVRLTQDRAVPPVQDDIASQAQVIDFGDEATRRMILGLQAEDPAGWLGRTCQADTNTTYQVSSEPGYIPDPEYHYREAVITVRGDTGRVRYRHVPPPQRREETPRRVATIDATAVARLQAMLDAADYPAAFPARVCGGVDSGRMRFESCIDGRYHAFACTDPAGSELADNVLRFAAMATEESP